MNSVILILFAFFGYIFSYYIYGKYLSRKIFKLNNTRITPACKNQDGHDYVPSKKALVFGHHFTSIAGLGPIVGPAVAIIWGWVPAVLWVVFGSILIGAVHDFAALVVSMRNNGKTIGEAAGKIVNSRTKVLFLLIIFFGLWIVIAVFSLIIALLFTMYPSSVFPVWAQILIALWFGYLVYRKSSSVILTSGFALILIYLTIASGTFIPVRMPSILGYSPETVWIVILLAYVFFASTLPVWRLLQPRDFINSLQLAVILFLLILGSFFAQAPIVAPAYNPSPEGAPPIMPFLFIIIACGAVSGFHSLVSSGTSSKQICRESDALFIGYGSMLLEGALAILVIVAIAAGVGLGLKGESGTLKGVEAWNSLYFNWQALKGLSANMRGFVAGSSNLLASIGIPKAFAITLMGVFLVSFANTTLDSAVRLQRYVINELASTFHLTVLTGRYPATAFAVLTAFLLVFMQPGGKGALILWPLFGSVNQLLAGLTLLVATAYLVKKECPSYVTAIPMVFMLVMTGWAMVMNIQQFYRQHNWLLVFIGLVVLILEIWMLVESLIVLKQAFFDKLTSRVEEAECE